MFNPLTAGAAYRPIYRPTGFHFFISKLSTPFKCVKYKM